MNILKDLYNILMPRICVVCRGTLEPDEHFICTNCAIQLPRYPLKSIEDNEPLRKVWNFAPVQYGATLFYYRQQSDYHHLVTNVKYKGQSDLGIMMGKWAALEIAHLGLAGKVDVIIPVPTDKNRKRERGYNQAEMIAIGLGEGMDKPVKTFLKKKNAVASQTKLDKTARIENATGIYQAKIPEAYKGKSILLVDDVLTTGATIGNCALALLADDPLAKISIFTIAYAG